MHIGGTNDWFRPGSSIIGLATYDPGNLDDSNYGFAFTEELSIYHQYSGGSLLKFSEYLANLVSHEAAHTYGANHVTDTSALMNPYLPINPRTSMFGSGTVPGSSTFQDTQDLLGNNIGYADSADDYPDTIATAQTISPTTTSLSGILERRDDIDAFQITPNTSGVMTLDIDTTTYANLDALLSVYANNNLIAQNDDYAGSLDSLLDVNVIAGTTYTITVASSASETSGTYILNLDAPDATPQITLTDNSGLANDHAIHFDQITVGASATATFTLANPGAANLTVSNLTIASPFDLDESSTLTLTPGQTQTITLTFAPDTNTDLDTTITLTTNDPNNPTVTLNITATTQLPVPDITLANAGQTITTDTLDLGNLTRGDTQTQTFTVQNTGYDTLTIDNVLVTGDAQLTTGFPGSQIALEPGQSTNLTLTLDTTDRGALDGQIILQTNDPDQPNLTLDLQAQVVAGILTITENSDTPNDNTLNFGDVYIGDLTTQTLTLANIGDADLTLTDIDLPAPFTFTTNTNDTLTLAPGQTIDLNINFAPLTAQDTNTALTFTTDDLDYPTAAIQLTGLRPKRRPNHHRSRWLR